MVAEHRLGFGHTLSSNVGQRFADAILWYFEKEFDREEDAHFARILEVTWLGFNLFWGPVS